MSISILNGKLKHAKVQLLLRLRNSGPGMKSLSHPETYGKAGLQRLVKLVVYTEWW